MKNKALALTLILFGSLVLMTEARAEPVAELEGVYCRFELSDWQGWRHLFQKRSKCKVTVDTRDYGDLDWNQPIAPQLPEWWGN